MYTLGTSQIRWIGQQLTLPILNNKLVGFVGTAVERTATDPAVGQNEYTVFFDTTNAPTSVTIFSTIMVNGAWVWDVDNTVTINDPTVLLQLIKTASGWTQAIYAIQRGDTASMDKALQADGVLYWNREHNCLYIYNGVIGQWQRLTNGVSSLSTVVGTVFGWASSLPIPIGFLRCDGHQVLVADYPALFAAIGYTYGGSGISFQLPTVDNSVILSQF